MFFIGRRRVDGAGRSYRVPPRADWRPGRAQSSVAARLGGASSSPSCNERGGTRVCESGRLLLPARPSRRSSRLHGSDGLKASIEPRWPRVGGPSPKANRSAQAASRARGAKRQADSVRDTLRRW